MTHADNRFLALTDARRLVLDLVEQEGAVSARDVSELFRRNIRTAAKVLKDLSGLGLVEPVRICEYKLSKAGRAWLDAHRRAL